jgi:murein L,D-transpeptidase YcbB/YkuD
MNEFKFQITTFLLVALLAFGGYFAFTSLDRGVTYTKDDIVAVVQNQQTDDETEEPVIVTDDGDTVSEEPEPTPDISTPKVLTDSEENLVGRLQGLIDDNINMKEGSRGTRVGTVQEFLNIYLDTASGVDNQYGPGTLSRVRQFQEAEGLSADGLAGPNTYEAMIQNITEA